MPGVNGAAAPDVDAGEQEQPHHVDEVPVPRREFEAEMLRGSELTGIGTDQAHDQEDRADDDVEAVEAGRHEEGGAVDVAGIMERRMAVFEGLDAGEGNAECDGEYQAELEALAVA